jgi:hypothetical protein
MRDIMRGTSIKLGTIMFGAVMALAFLAVILTGQAALFQLKVGGPVYGQLERDSSLISDILPPPEYIVESYLEAAMAMEQPQNVSEHRARLQTLRRRYEDRRNYWMNQPVSPAIKSLLARQSDTHVRNFSDLAEKRFLPAL